MVGIARAETDIATQSVILPSIVSVDRCYDHTCSFMFVLYTLAGTYKRASVHAERHPPMYADAASVLLAILEIASETRKSFIFFAVHCCATTKHKVRTYFSLFFPLHFSILFILSRRLFGRALDFSLWIKSGT